MSIWKSMDCAPMNGHSVLLKTQRGVIQASYHFGRWHEEKEWTKAELSQPDRPIIASGWIELPEGEK